MQKAFIFKFFCVTALGGLHLTTDGLHRCQHKSPTIDQLQYAAVAETYAERYDGHVKRQADSEFQPLRIKARYDKTVEDLPDDVRKQIKEGAVENVIEQFKNILAVRPIKGKLLFQRDCVNGSKAFLNPGGYCSKEFGCTNYSTCFGTVHLPKDLFAACRVCDDDGTNCDIVEPDGAGVTDTDFMLNVFANTSFLQCAPGGAALAFAAACQLERQYDRPVAGFANICVNRALEGGIENLRSILFHEITHALLFSPVLMPFYRDEHGHPRTTRDPQTGLPTILQSDHLYKPGSTTLNQVFVSRTTIPNGTFTYPVSELVTPALAREVRSHFGCDTLAGALIEDIPIKGTGGTHFEQRVFGNEIMTGAIDASNGVISRITLALYEDSGWYRPNYDLAKPLRWGLNMGCDFVKAGCLSPKTMTLRPSFCSDRKALIGYKEAKNQGKQATFREDGFNSTCAWDRGSFGVCAFANSSQPVPPDVQYFRDPHLEGLDALSDHCPIIYSTVSCKQERDPYLTINAFGEKYGPQSKCVEFRVDRDWVFANAPIPPILGGACYEVYCNDVEGPFLSILGTNYSCGDQREIHIKHVDLPDVLNVITIVCPPCLDLCWDNVKACEGISPPSSEVPSQEPTAAPTGDINTSFQSIAFFAAGGVVIVIALIVLCVAVGLICLSACCKRTKPPASSTPGYKISSPIQTEDDDSYDEDDDEDLLIDNH